MYHVQLTWGSGFSRSLQGKAAALLKSSVGVIVCDAGGRSVPLYQFLLGLKSYFCALQNYIVSVLNILKYNGRLYLERETTILHVYMYTHTYKHAQVILLLLESPNLRKNSSGCVH